MEIISNGNARQLRAIQLRFIRNCRGFWSRYRLLIYLLLFTAALDAFSTTHFMVLRGWEVEAHPHIRLLSGWLGPFWGPWLGKGAQCSLGILVTIYVRKYARLILCLASILYFSAFLCNYACTMLFYT